MHVLLVPAIVAVPYLVAVTLALCLFHRVKNPPSPRPLDLQTPEQRLAGHRNLPSAEALWERHDEAWSNYLRAPLGSAAKANAFALWQELGKLAMRAEARARHASLDAGVRP